MSFFRQIPDHPEISRMQREGYYSDVLLCPNCGEPLGDFSFEIDGEFVCTGCFEDWVREHPPLELASLLNIRTSYGG